MPLNKIIVLGASTGGFEAIKNLVRALPPDLPVAIFIVWHMSSEVRGVLPQTLARLIDMPVAHAVDGETIVGNRIYIAPPDHHMLIERGRVRLTKGPKENRFRPAIDPLFRSAALHYGPGVIGVILSGALDDGSSGLWSVKNRGGTAIVQDPREAEMPSMPESAIRTVNVDHIVKIAEMPNLFDHLTRTTKTGPAPTHNDEQELRRISLEVGIASEANALDLGIMETFNPSPYTCPECHGVLSTLREGNAERFRCHTGHAYSVDSLLSGFTENIEKSLWDTIRGIEEVIILLNHLGDHYAEVNDPKLAALFFQKAKEAYARNQLVRRSAMMHEQYSAGSLREEVASEPDDRWETEISARADH